MLSVSVILSWKCFSCVVMLCIFAQQEIGLFWGGLRTLESSHCVVQLLEPETAISQGCVLDEFDCPLLKMVNLFRVIPSSSVCTAVSVVHKCTNTCERAASAVVEGCDISVNRLVFVCA